MDRERIINSCYEVVDTDIPPEVFMAVFNVLDRAGYVLHRTGAWDQPVIDLCPACQTPMTRNVYMTDLRGNTEYQLECPACKAKDKPESIFPILV